MSETCEFCGEGATDELGEPMYYETLDIYAPMDCAIDEGVGMD